MIYYDLVRFKLPLQIFILIFQHNRPFYKYINFNDLVWSGEIQSSIANLYLKFSA